MSFLDTLAQKGIITQEDISLLEQESQKNDESIEEILRKRGVAPADILAAKESYYSIPQREIGDVTVPFEALSYIPEESAKHYRAVPIGLADGVLEVGIIDPDNIEARDALQFISAKTNVPYKLFLISEEDFTRVLKTYRGLSGQVTKALTDLESEMGVAEQGGAGAGITEGITNLDVATGSGEEKSDTGKIIEDAPVTKIVATILKHAIEARASDVHIEPIGETLRVRYRIDGVLETSLTLPMKVHQAVVARIKILSNMKLDEKRKPQDNRFSARIAGRKIDFRVSTFPSYYGEKVVMRILDPEKGVIPLDDIGLSEHNLAAVRRAIARPYGLILISGPTGSGKTTTLYSMLNEVDRDTKNVLSLEDPVEYNVPGLSQSQVRPEIGYTFASGLRTTLRQDPDVIMVGEIRDKETAGLAVQAALTGHLVLSTIHTNNAIGVIPRLIDMGVDPYLIAPTLALAMAQRLVKTLCEGGGKEVPVEGSIKLMIDSEFQDLPAEYKKMIPKNPMVYEATPTESCPTGTKGRMAVFEVLEMNPELERIILEDPVEPKLMAAARKTGMLTMREDAILKAFEKKIPFNEISMLGGAHGGGIDEDDLPPVAEHEEVPPEVDESSAEPTTSEKDSVPDANTQGDTGVSEKEV